MNAVSIDPILNLQDVIYRSGLSRATIYRKIACGTFEAGSLWRTPQGMAEG